MIAPPAFKGRGGHNSPGLIVVKSKAVGVVICDALSCGRGYLWVEKVAVELDRKEFTRATPNAADSRKYEAVDGER